MWAKYLAISLTHRATKLSVCTHSCLHNRLPVWCTPVYAATGPTIGTGAGVFYAGRHLYDSTHTKKEGTHDGTQWLVSA